MNDVSRRDFLRRGAATAGAMAGAGAIVDFLPGNLAQAATTPATQKGITVVDQLGRHVHLAGAAKRVITIPIPTASMVMSLAGGAGRLVGMNPSAKTAIVDGILNDIYPHAKSIASDVCDSSFNPNIETILGLHPDVVIQWGSMGSSIITPLENAGITTIGVDYGTQQDLTSWITLFGKILGQSDRAASFDQYQASVLSLVKKSAPQSPANPPKILYFQAVVDSFEVAGASTYNDYYIRLVGGQNPAGALNGDATIDVEQIISWNPDVILVGNFDAGTPQTITGNPSLASVSAVQSNRVYKVPLGGYRWDPPNQESPLMWRWLSQIAYPTRTYPWNLRKAIANDYQLLYSYNPNQAQIDGVLQMDLNRSAANYGRFAS